MRSVADSDEALERLIDAALAEDASFADLTTELVVEAHARCRAQIVQKQAGVICGIDIARAVFSRLDVALSFRDRAEEGIWREGGIVCEILGPARPILAAERVALNFLAHLSGIATETARFVKAIENTPVVLLDTRKTTPGLRSLERRAVVCGGGTNHRYSLADAVLIKENHVACAGGIANAVSRALEGAPASVAVEVECRTSDDVRAALAAGATHILVDNMPPEQIAAVVQAARGQAYIEASGQVNLETARRIAECGVDAISVGKITHSAQALDLSLRVEPL